MNKFKDKLTKQLLMSYLLMLVSDLLIALLYMLIYNELLWHVIKDLKNINILQGYLIFYCARLVFNRNNIKLSPEEEIFDSFKRNTLKFVHYLFWGFAIKLLFIFCM
jgi:hypothetical protein